MITVAEIVDYQRGRGREVQTFGDQLIRITIDVDGVPVHVGLQLTASPRGTSWVTVLLKVCPADHLRSRAALVANADLPDGAFAIVRDHAVLQQKLPLGSLRLDVLDPLLESIARTGLGLRKSAEAGDGEHAFAFR